MYGIIKAFSTVLHFRTLCHGVPLISRQIYVLIYEVSDWGSEEFGLSRHCHLPNCGDRQQKNWKMVCQGLLNMLSAP